MTVLRVGVVQVASSLEPNVNRERLHDLVPTDTDLVVLPEAFARDFGRAESALGPWAESLDGPFVAQVAAVAGARETTVVVGMFEKGPVPDRPYNTLVVRGAAAAEYRKMHLYDAWGFRESDRMSAGAPEPQTVEVAGVRIGLMTCYDLRFPELARALVDDGADLLVVCAAWVAGPRKVDHWRTLIRARAIENTVFVVAAAQPAPRYCGHSMIVGPLGDVLVEAGGSESCTIRAEIDTKQLGSVRRINPSLMHRRIRWQPIVSMETQ